MSGTASQSGSASTTGNNLAIYVHAGAGFHSTQNERIHLSACSDASLAGMRILRAGGTAVDAVEMAIKVLEDREVTNAGYGSNLTIDGQVEGDAVVIDHFGRSGGCSAVQYISNPISLARTILDTSYQPLSLKRVAPNFLVGHGATDFAFRHSMPIVPNSQIVSSSSYERWRRWKKELRVIEQPSQAYNDRSAHGLSPAAGASFSVALPPEIQFQNSSQTQCGLEASIHATPTHAPSPSLVSNVWNETEQSATPKKFSNYAYPPVSGPLQRSAPGSVPCRDPTQTSKRRKHSNNIMSSILANMSGRNDDGANQSPGVTAQQLAGFADSDHDCRMLDVHSGTSMEDKPVFGSNLPSSFECRGFGTTDPAPLLSSTGSEAQETQNSTRLDGAQGLQKSPLDEIQHESSVADGDTQGGGDCITDTVGAIAIDCFGNVACGASSGGIGMKFSGRVGPAAIAGVGAAIVPVNLSDEEHTTTAVVASGTGEQMLTTRVAEICAERLHMNLRKSSDGRAFQEADDDDAIKMMLTNEFLHHPAVLNDVNNTAAIGVLAVKKSIDGVNFYFAHNTDSFAVASMQADDRQPSVLMSRNWGRSRDSIAQGGRPMPAR